MTASLLTEVCHGVSTEPHLQPLSGEAMVHGTANVEDGARLDVAVHGFWGGRFEKAFLDVRVFNPSARSNRQASLQAVYRRHEQEKKRQYEQRVREVEHGTFTPLVLSSTGRNGQSGNSVLQTTGLNAKREEGCSLQQGNGMAPMPNELRPATLLHHVHQGSQIISTPPSNRIH